MLTEIKKTESFNADHLEKPSSLLTYFKDAKTYLNSNDISNKEVSDPTSKYEELFNFGSKTRLITHTRTLLPLSQAFFIYYNSDTLKFSTEDLIGIKSLLRYNSQIIELNDREEIWMRVGTNQETEVRGEEVKLGGCKIKIEQVSD